MTLAVKYRPHTLEEVVEQNIAVNILKKQIETKNFKNCYGFFGTTGAGKTTCARIFANAINNGVGDPIEIDGATNGNVDSIKMIVDTAKERAIVGEYKVIIIDECQMLGGGRKENSPAWSALLKCIEECPKYTIFIFCSTNPEKIPDAILNRIQRFNFTPISTQGIANRLFYICQREGFTNYEKICDFISKNCRGSMRNAITYLEQISDYSRDLSMDAAKRVLGGLSYETFFRLTWAITQKNDAEIFSTLNELFDNGQDLKGFIDDYFNFTVDLLKFIIFKNINCTNIPSYLASNENPVVQDTVNVENNLKIFNELADRVLEIKQTIKGDSDYKNTIIIMLIQFIRGEN